MTNRREFLQIGIAACTLPFAAPAAAAFGHGSATPTVVPLYAALYDVRFPDGVEFARRIERHGIRAHAFEGDVTRLWYDELYHVWRAGPAAIAGLTAHGPLFCLERLAWDQGLRVVFRAEHKLVDRRIEHELTGPGTMLGGAVENAGVAGWAACMADAVVRCPSARNEIALDRRRPTTRAEARASGEPLYTWVIAPARKARPS